MYKFTIATTVARLRKCLVATAIAIVAFTSHRMAFAQPENQLKMEIVSSDIIRSYFANNPNWQLALDQSRNSIDKFIAEFKRPRGKAQTHFIVSAFDRVGDICIPFGVLVERIDGDRIIGRLVPNKLDVVEENHIEIPLSSVVDWRYIDTWELFGASLFRTMFHDQTEIVQQKINERFEKRALIKPKVTLTQEHRVLTQHIANARSGAALEIIRDGNKQFEDEVVAFSPPYETSSRVEIFRDRLIHYCVIYGDRTLLIGLGDRLRQSMRGEFPLLNRASAIGNVDAIEVLLAMGADIESKAFTQTSLHQATSFNRFDAVKCLLENGADPNTYNSSNRRPIHSAKSVAVAELLVEYGAEINVISDSESRPMDSALEHGRLDIVKFLISKGHPVPKDIEEWLKTPPPEVRGRELREAMDAELPESEQLYDKEYREVDYGCILPIRELKVPSK